MATASHSSDPDTFDGMVSEGELYTIRAACRRLGWTASAWRAARRAGLLVFKFGKRKYLKGDDLIAFLSQFPDS